MMKKNEDLKMHKKITKELLGFIENCPSVLHTVNTSAEMLRKTGFAELREGDTWKLKAGGKYFVKKSMTAIIAFIYPNNNFSSFSIVSPHGDSPCFRIKESPEMKVDGHYTKLNTEVYGGMTLNLWLDRPLSAAGRVIYKSANGVSTKLVNIDRDLFVIPSLAPHLNREAGESKKINPQVDTLPLFGNEKADFMATLAKEADIDKEDIVSYDMYLYNREHGTFWGENEEFFSSSKLDDLQCSFAALKALTETSNSENVQVCAIFDNEEIGSMTKQGADSTFLADTLKRISLISGKSEQEHMQAVARGFMVSADNGHAVHPLYPDKSDPTSRCYVNGGVVIKNSTAYATDAISSAVFKQICDNAKVPHQSYFNRSDIRGGSTLGNISNTHVSMNTVDIGVAQLAMHSPYESGGTNDTLHLVNAMKEFYSSVIEEPEVGCFNVRKSK